MTRIRLLMIALVATLLVLAPGGASAARLSDNPESRLSTIPHDAGLQDALRAARIDDLVVRHDGWNETMASWSRILLWEMTGRSSIHGQDPEFTVLSMMYDPQSWFDAKVLPIEHPHIGEVLGIQGKWLSPREVTENPSVRALAGELEAASATKAEYDRLVKMLNAVHQARQLGADRPDVYDSVTPPEMSPDDVRHLATDETAYKAAHARRVELRDAVAKDRALLKAGQKLFDRTTKLLSLQDEFLIVPDPADVTGGWMTAAAAARQSGDTTIVEEPVESDRPRVEQISTSGVTAKPLALGMVPAAGALHRAFADAFRAANGDALRDAIPRFLDTVRRSSKYPSNGYVLRKNLYTRHNPFQSAYLLYGLSTLLFALFAFFERKSLRTAALGAMGVGLVIHTSGLLLRLLLTGHVPVSNMYESIVFATWSAMSIGFLFELRRKSGVVGLAVAALGLIALMGVSLMPLHETRIHPLRAVLNSYWLNIHVTAMLISYGAFAVAALFAGGYLVKALLKRDSLFGGSTPLMPMEQMEEFSYRLVQVGWPILTVGIMLGAVWADTAWGRYWGWDPKETWALITWIVYTIYLHSRMVMGWKGRVSSLACVIGFLMVLITWLGVSYLPWFAGGLHTYASPT